MQIYRYSDGVWANTALLLYLSLGGAALVYLLSGVTESAVNGMTTTIALLITIIATLLLAHLMILAAYLAHECMHNTVFKKPVYNDYFGAVLTWLLGAGYLPYKTLKDKHLRHHTERRDVLSLDYRQWLQRHPVLEKLITGAQWYHLPAAEILTRVLSSVSPFFLSRKRQWRQRVIWMALSRLLFFIALYLIDAALLFGYLVASIVCMTALGFMDAYQHTYDIALSLDNGKSAPEYGRDYEEGHTYSNLLSKSLPRLNLLVLNFCYHNVHHWKSGEPWYRLPRLHSRRYPDGSAQEIPFAVQWHNYHHYRVQRVLWQPDRSEQQSQAVGASGVSFLIGV